MLSLSIKELDFLAVKEKSILVATLAGKILIDSAPTEQKNREFLMNVKLLSISRVSETYIDISNL